MNSIFQKLQKAIYLLLSQDAPLQALLGATVQAPSVFDHVPDMKIYPYIRITGFLLSDRGNEDWDGVTINYQISVWHRGINLGNLKVQDIQARVDALLHRTELCIVGVNIVAHNRVTTQILPEDDGRTLHGVQIFSVSIGE